MGQTPQIPCYFLFWARSMGSFFLRALYCLIYWTINSDFFNFRSSYLWMCGTFNHTFITDITCNFSRFKILYLFFWKIVYDIILSESSPVWNNNLHFQAGYRICLAMIRWLLHSACGFILLTKICFPTDRDFTFEEICDGDAFSVVIIIARSKLNERVQDCTTSNQKTQRQA
jgi:hypothetical protein